MLDLSSVLDWDTSEKALSEYHALVREAPMRSVVISFSPDAAGAILELTNRRNRRIQRYYLQRVLAEMDAGKHRFTGDTIKFDRNGTLIDGQHRLYACVKSGRTWKTHVVFGLEPDTIDVIDSGKRRTAADLLTISGVANGTVLSSGVRWALIFEGSKGFRDEVSPHEILTLVRGRMADMPLYMAGSRHLWVAFKHPPGLMLGLLWTIAQHAPAVPETFVHEWLHGARVGRNETFDVLSNRLRTLAHEGVTLSHKLRAALIVQAFNCWFAGEVASPRTLTWRKDWEFPTLRFTADAPPRSRRRKSVEATVGVAPSSEGDVPRETSA